MAEYLLQVEAADLADFAAAVNDEEAGGSEFVKNTISFFEGKFTNLVTMKPLPPGSLPDAELDATAFGAVPPVGKELVWSGAVITSGTNVAASVYR